MLTRHFKSCYLFFVICFLLTGSLLYGSDKVKQLVIDAIDYTDTVNFQSVTEVEQQGMRLTSYLIRVTDKDKKTYLKNDIYQGRKLIFTYLVRDGKIFQINGKNIVENNVDDPAHNPMLSWKIYQQIKSVLEKLDCSYKMSDSYHNGISCYKVTVKFPDDKASLAKLGPDVEPGAIPRIIEFVIGKAQKFIYETKLYDADGNLAGEIVFGKVRFNTEYNAETFKLPRTREIKVANGAKGIEKIYNTRTSSFSNVCSSVSNFFASIFNGHRFYTLSSVLTRVFIVLAIVCVGFVNL